MAKKQMQLTVKQALALAKKEAKKGNTATAVELYSAILKHQPGHATAENQLKRLQTAPVRTNNPTEIQAQALLEIYNAGQMTKTAQGCRDLLKTYPKSEFLFNLLGIALQAQGKLAEAVDAFDRAIQSKPDFAQAFSNRGNALRALGKLEAAVESHANAIRFAPDFSQAYNNRGSALKALGKLREAKQDFDEAIRIDPGYAQAHHNRAGILKSLGNPEGAIEGYTEAIRINPGYIQAYYNRASVFKDMENPEAAVADYSEAIRLKPDYAQAFNGRGNAYSSLGKFQEAMADFDKCVALKPDFAPVYNNRGNLLVTLGEREKALEDYEKAIRCQPDFSVAYSNRGNLLGELGLLQDAQTNYEKAIELAPETAWIHRNLSTLKTYVPGDPQIDQMLALYNDSQPGDTDRTHLCFSLAKAYGDLKAYDKSFAFLEEGNRLRKQALDYDLDQDLRVITGIMELFDTSPVETAFIPKTEFPFRPVFIVGMPRSGTSLVEQIVSSHSLVYGAGELTTINQILDPFLNRLVSGGDGITEKQRFLEDAVSAVFKGYLEKLSSLNVPEKVITDKMPLNFTFIGLILSAFPNAKIVNLSRDPRATCWSIYKHYFSNRGNGYAYDMADIAKFYRYYTDMMAFWHKRFPGKIHDLNYERLTEHQEEETRRLLSFCDLAWEDACLEFHKSDRAVKTASSSQVRKKLYKGSSDAWRNYEQHLAPLLKALGY